MICDRRVGSPTMIVGASGATASAYPSPLLSALTDQIDPTWPIRAGRSISIDSILPDSILAKSSMSLSRLSSESPDVRIISTYTNRP